MTATTKTIDKSSISENASVEDASSDTLPPLEFPSDDALPKNETALKILQSVSSQSSKSTKVIDLSRNLNLSKNLSAHLAC